MVSMASDIAFLKSLVVVMTFYAFISNANSNVVRITEVSSGKVGDTYRPLQPCDEETSTGNEETSTGNDSENEEHYNCKTCSDRKAKLSDQDMKAIRFQVIKEHILQKLQMTRPPCLRSHPKPNIESVLFATETKRNDTEMAENDGKAQTERAVTFSANDNGYSCSGDSDYPCANLKFSFPDDITRDIISRTELWLYPINNNTLRLSEIIPFMPKVNLSFVTEATPNNWIKFDLGNFITWFDSGDHLSFDVEVKCDNDCDTEEGWPIALEGEKRPFLITYIRRPKANSRSRDRRSIDCHEDTVTCCREAFRISFSELGWDNWILYPEGYKANFCKGKCIGEISISRYHHSTVIHSYIGSNNATAVKMGLTMCCTPSRMSGIDIIFRDEKGGIYQRSLPNMVVEECDCA